MVTEEATNILFLYLVLRHVFQDGSPVCVDKVKKNINKKTNKGKHLTKQNHQTYRSSLLRYRTDIDHLVIIEGT